MFEDYINSCWDPCEWGLQLFNEPLIQGFVLFQFLIIYKNRQWEEVACNPARFYEEFQLEADIDAEAMRKIICEVVVTNSSVFSELLNNIQMADFINEVKLPVLSFFSRAR